MIDKFVYTSLHFIMKYAGTLNAWAWRKHAKILERSEESRVGKEEGYRCVW